MVVKMKRFFKKYEGFFGKIWVLIVVMLIALFVYSPSKVKEAEASLWKVLTARWGSGAGEVDQVRMDAATNSLQTIDYAHHEIHSGSSFNISTSADVANGANYDFVLISPDSTKWAHILSVADVERESKLQIFEDVTFVGGGDIDIVNRNRNSIKSNTITAVVASSVSDFGTKIFETKVGSRRSTGGESRSEGEIIMKQNSNLLLRITNQSGSEGWVAPFIDWYEHTDKH